MSLANFMSSSDFPRCVSLLLLIEDLQLLDYPGTAVLLTVGVRDKKKQTNVSLRTKICALNAARSSIDVAHTPETMLHELMRSRPLRVLHLFQRPSIRH